MRVVRIDGARVVDWESFHDVFAAALAFPDYYGRNLDAWIDCASDLDPVTIVVDNAAAMARPQYAALVECAAFVNWRFVEAGGAGTIALAFTS